MTCLADMPQPYSSFVHGFRANGPGTPPRQAGQVIDMKLANVYGTTDH